MRETIPLEPLTSEAFAPFGQVISSHEAKRVSANRNTAYRLNGLARLQNLRASAQANVALFELKAQALPFEVKLLEQHPFSSQLFVPMRCSRFLVCVAAASADGQPDEANIRAFVGSAEQAINYHPGTWHHPIIAFDSDAVFVMLAWEDGTTSDTSEYELDVSHWVAMA